MYLAHLQKACFLTNVPTDWLTPAVLTCAAGLANAQVRSFQFPNVIRCADLMQLLTLTPYRGEFGQLAFLSYIFSLRAPSETLQLVRAFANDPVTEYKPQEQKALIGVRKYKDALLLVIKFAFRKTSGMGVS